MTTSNRSLEGRTVLVTGAAGGVGRATVDLLSAMGANVVAEDVVDAVSSLESKAGRIVALKGDVRNKETAAAAVQLAQSCFGGLDVLVNNAAVILSKTLLDTEEAEWDDLMAVNVKGVFHHVRAALPLMLEQGRGAIVNVSSISGVLGLAGQAAYCASKGAVVQLTRQLAVEYASAGIRVNSVAPGAVDTPFLARHLDAQPNRDEAVAAVNAAHPLGRYALPGEIAEVIAFLASDASSFITGAVVMADGGYSAC